MNTPTLQDRYRRIRAEHPTLRASQAILWARHDEQVDALAAVAEWDYHDAYSGPMMTATIANVCLDVFADPEPYDWGDIDPTDDERDATDVIGVSVRLVGDDPSDSLMALWGIGFNRYKSDPEREALSFAVESGYFDLAQAEVRERAEWAARDTVTVDR